LRRPVGSPSHSIYRRLASADNDDISANDDHARPPNNIGGTGVSSTGNYTIVS
jgi:hypothetical protein